MFLRPVQDVPPHGTVSLKEHWGLTTEQKENEAESDAGQQWTKAMQDAVTSSEFADDDMVMCCARIRVRVSTDWRDILRMELASMKIRLPE